MEKIEDLRTFPPEKRLKYPHLFPRDVATWERFIEKYGSLYNSFAYDVRVGKPTWVFPHWRRSYKKDARILSKLRIDVVGFTDKVIDIIEVKPRATSSAIGQVLTYKEQFIEDFKPKLPVRAVIVAGAVDPNIIPLTEKLKVVYIKV